MERRVGRRSGECQDAAGSPGVRGPVLSPSWVGSLQDRAETGIAGQGSPSLGLGTGEGNVCG